MFVFKGKVFAHMSKIQHYLRLAGYAQQKKHFEKFVYTTYKKDHTRKPWEGGPCRQHHLLNRLPKTKTYHTLLPAQLSFIKHIFHVPSAGETRN